MTGVEKTSTVEAQRPLLLRHTKSIMISIKDLVDIKLYKWNRHLEALHSRQATALFPFHTWADQAKKWWFLGLRRLSKDRHGCRGSMLRKLQVLLLRHRIIWAAQWEGVLRIASQPYVISWVYVAAHLDSRTLTVTTSINRGRGVGGGWWGLVKSYVWAWAWHVDMLSASF